MEGTTSKNGTYFLNLNEGDLVQFIFETRYLDLNTGRITEIKQCFLVDILFSPLTAYTPNNVLKNRYNFLFLNLIFSHFHNDLGKDLSGIISTCVK